MRRPATSAALACFLAAGLTGCIAPDVEVQGALGLSVDAERRPVLLVEPCGTAAVRVTLSGTREGLDPAETNRQDAEWTAMQPPTALSELALHQPGPTWRGPAFTPRPGLGYIAEAGNTTREGVISQVSFYTDDLPDLRPGTVYVGPDLDTGAYRELTREEFVGWACSRS